ncbi:hypothetical protein ACP3S7_28235 [Phytobacter ursingii]
MFCNEVEINTYIIVGILLFTCTSVFCKGFLSSLGTLAALGMLVFALVTWF